MEEEKSDWSQYFDHTLDFIIYLYRIYISKTSRPQVYVWFYQGNDLYEVTKVWSCNGTW